ncbi:MAG: prepilin-type N-terminal cleavage/methylation domain-containing protein [Clostridia bacterium]|nr:prepilin-type N-terminal cleavage/methylation domain-containing protein [Clostridia bacterium]
MQKMYKMKKRKNGFTLVELSIVIAVIAILVAVLVPTFIALLDRANESVDSQLVSEMNTSLSISSAVNGKPESVGDAVDILVADGYDESFTTKADNTVYKWDNEQNIVVLWNTKENVAVYPEGYTTSATAKLYNLTVVSGEYAGFAYGNGTENNPYIMATTYQLESLRTYISTSGGSAASQKVSGSNVKELVSQKLTASAINMSERYFKLDRDLVLGDTFTPFGNITYVGDYYGEGVYVTSASESGSFIGVFDGDFHTITMTDSIYNEGQSDYALFANVLSSGDSNNPTTIKNLNIVMDVHASVSDYYYDDDECILDVAPNSCSALATNILGDGADSIIIENITVTGTITAGVTAGGIAKTAYGCTFKNCVNYANITTVSTNYANDYDSTTIGGICAVACNYDNMHSSGYTELINVDLSVAFDNCINYGTLMFKYKSYDYSNADTAWIWCENDDWNIIYNIGQIVGTVSMQGTYATSYGVDNLPILLELNNCKANGEIVVYCHTSDGDIYNFEGTYYKHDLDEEKWIGDEYGNWSLEYTETSGVTYNTNPNTNKQLIGGTISKYTKIDGVTYSYTYTGDSYMTFTSGTGTGDPDASYIVTE